MSEERPYYVQITVKHTETSEIFPSNPFSDYQNVETKHTEHSIGESLSFDELGELKRCLEKIANKRKKPGRKR